MILYFDENLPFHLVKGFKELQIPENLKKGIEIEVKSLPKEFGYGVKDFDWIPKAGKQKACVVTQDININRRKHELELYRQNKVDMFFLQGKNKKQGMSVWQMVEALARNWEDIVQIILKEKRPFAYQIKSGRKMEKLP